jgi:hypothetical protein
MATVGTGAAAAMLASAFDVTAGAASGLPLQPDNVNASILALATKGMDKNKKLVFATAAALGDLAESSACICHRLVSRFDSNWFISFVLPIINQLIIINDMASRRRCGGCPG